MRDKNLHVVAILVAVLAALGPVAAEAQEDYSQCFELDSFGCPKQILNCPLKQPETIEAKVTDMATGKTTLDTKVVAKKRTARCVPVLIGGAGGGNQPAGESSVEWQTLTLRNYGDTFPGTTYRVWKDRLKDPSKEYDPDDNPVEVAGTRFRLLLENRLAYAPGENTLPRACKPARYAACTDDLQQACVCDFSTSDCNDLTKYTCAVDGLSPDCTVIEVEQRSPNCSHGVEVTNLHYHGTHVSPQPHQDYVLLSLYPYDQPGWPFGYDPNNLPANVAIGSYQTDIPTFPWNQAPGTHWYHAHKHGSTATQMINGMAGALLIQGELDLWLLDYFKPPSVDSFEKVMIVQQIAEDVPFPLGADNYPPYPLINGQMVPTVAMQYGETQRWRMVSATTNAITQTSFSFPAASFPGFDVRQIAQDGVQFAPENYGSDPQPLGDAETGFLLSPGNRVDLLVRAPDDPGDGKARVFYVMKRTVGAVTPELRAVLREQGGVLNRRLGIPTKDQGFEGPLFRIYVSGHAANPKPLPEEDEWPAMPPYLSDITRAEIDASGNNAVAADRTMAFSMTNGTNGMSANGSPQSAFFIDGRQYADTCAGSTVNVGSAEAWTVTNNSTPNHPYHIHINPFQLVSKIYYDTNTNEWVETRYSRPFPWMDTIPLQTGTVVRPSLTKIRQRFEDYTGAYVIHCHFLGHEDRGMMTNVQSVCTDPTHRTIFGEPQGDGLADDCDFASTTGAGSPLPPCPGFLPADGE